MQIADWSKESKLLKEQEPCVDTGDVISRDAAIRLAEQGQIQGFEWQFKELNKLPPVIPQTKIGQWILLDECANSGYYCSECRKKVVKEGWSDTVKKIKYCPNCGAKMQDVEECSPNRGENYSFPEVFGEPIEMLIDGVWLKGKVINDYRSRDGIVNMETADGRKYWCGCERTDCYRQPKEGDEV